MEAEDDDNVEDEDKPVRYETEGVCPDSIEQFDEGEREVEEQETEEVSGIFVSKDESDPANLEHGGGDKGNDDEGVMYPLTMVSLHLPKIPLCLPWSSCRDGSILGDCRGFHLFIRPFSNYTSAKKT